MIMLLEKKGIKAPRRNRCKSCGTVNDVESRIPNCLVASVYLSCLALKEKISSEKKSGSLMWTSWGVVPIIDPNSNNNA